LAAIRCCAYACRFRGVCAITFAPALFCFFFFFVPTRRPPRSTLFPTRRSSDLFGSGREVEVHSHLAGDRYGDVRERAADRGRERSEEHTSELQSRGHLVCRLLLEKKKHTTQLPRPDTLSRRARTSPTATHRSCT